MLLLLLLLPLCSAGLLALLYRVNLRIYRRITIFGMTFPLIPLLYLIYEAEHQGSLIDYTIEFNSKVSIFSFNYGMDSVSLWLSIITSIVLLAGALSGVYIKKRHKQFYMLALLLQAVMFHSYLSRDALLLCACLLLTMFIMMMMLGIWGERDATKTARRFAYRQLAGIFFITMSCILLLGISSDYLQLNTVVLGEHPLLELNQHMLEEAGAQRLLAFIMLLLGLLFFLPIIGLHRPFLDIFHNSHLVITIMYSTTIGTLGIYLGYRLGLTYFADLLHAASKPIIWVAAIQWLFSCISLWHQKDAKGWLAYSVWGQYSLLLILLLVHSELGLTMLWLLVFSFQLLVGLLGVLLAAIQERAKTLNFDDLQGQLKQVPFATGLLVVSLLAWLGLPGLSHFLGTYHALLLSFPVSRWITVCLVLGVISSVAFAVRMLFHMQQGQSQLRHNKGTVNITELRFIEAFPAIILLSLVILIGCYPVIITDLLELQFHQLYLYWGQIETAITAESYNVIDVLRFNSEVWQLPVVLAVVMSLVIWLVNHKQTNLFRMLLWQVIYHLLTLIVVLGSAHALSETLDRQRIILIATWYIVMFIGSFSMLKHVIGRSCSSITGLQGLYYRQPFHAFVLLIFMLALMSAPLTAGFSFQLSMIELWSGQEQYGLIMLWLVAHALMATIPLESIIQMYVYQEQEANLLALKQQGQSEKLRRYVWLGYSSLLVVLGLAFWI